MFKPKGKKRPAQHDAKDDEGQEQQQWRYKKKESFEWFS